MKTAALTPGALSLARPLSLGMRRQLRAPTLRTFGPATLRREVATVLAGERWEWAAWALIALSAFGVLFLSFT